MSAQVDDAPAQATAVVEAEPKTAERALFDGGLVVKTDHWLLRSEPVDEKDKDKDTMTNDDEGEDGDKDKDADMVQRW